MARTGHMLTLMPTFRCNAECQHCGTASSPRNDTWLPLEHVLKYIEEAADEGYAGVVFSGGEPTMAADVLMAGLRAASSRSFPVRLVTNAQWAIDDETAQELLYEWTFAGLTEIHISTGDQHARFVPLDNVVRAARAAAAMALPVIVTVEVRDGNRLLPEHVHARLGDVPVTVVPWVWSALTPIPTALSPSAANRSNVHEHGGCMDLFESMTVQADGIISPCCGLGIRFVRELQVGQAGVDRLEQARERAMANPVLRMIREEGPERLLAAAADRDPRMQWDNMYTHRCHACIRILKDWLVREVVGQIANLPQTDSLPHAGG